MTYDARYEHNAPREAALESVLKSIDGYLAPHGYNGPYVYEDTAPRFINVQNVQDLRLVKEHFAHKGGQIYKVSDFARQKDYLPARDNMRYEIYRSDGAKSAFVFGLASQLLLEGLDAFRYEVRNIAFKSGRKSVYVCYRCEDHLRCLFNDPRLARLVHRVEGEKNELPKVIFASPKLSLEDYPLTGPVKETIGLETAAEGIEELDGGTLLVKTEWNTEREYPHSVLDTYSKSIFDMAEVISPNAKLLGNVFDCSVGVIGQDNAYLKYLGEDRGPATGEKIIALPARSLIKALNCKETDLEKGDNVRLHIDDIGRVVSAKSQDVEERIQTQDNSLCR